MKLEIKYLSTNAAVKYLNVSLTMFNSYRKRGLISEPDNSCFMGSGKNANFYSLDALDDAIGDIKEYRAKLLIAKDANIDHNEKAKQKITKESSNTILFNTFLQSHKRAIT